MKSKLKLLGCVAAVLAMLSMPALAAKKSAAKHVAIGTIASISGDQMVVNEKVKGKEQPMTFHLAPSTQKSGHLANGSYVTVQYHTEKNQNVANSVRERATAPTSK